MQIYRSTLYMPASNARAVDKARGLPCDAVILDLEDAVAVAAKSMARDQLAQELRCGGFGSRAVLVRINGLETPWGHQDAAALAGMPCDGVVLPKVNGPAQIDALQAVVPGRPVWAMIETPLGVLNAPQIAAHRAVRGLILGSNDLVKELRVSLGEDRSQISQSLQQVVLAARAYGRIALDGVCNAINDIPALEHEAAQGRALGFDGKTLIHPAQIAVANTTFAPSAGEVEHAERVISAFEAARAQGQGVAVLEGRIVESLHVETARAVLAMAQAIAARCDAE